MAKIIDCVKYRWIPTLLLCVACVAFSAIFISSDNQVLVNIANAIRRVPGFFVGYWMGKAIMEKKDVHSWLFLTIPFVLVGVLVVLPFKVYYFGLMMFPLFLGQIRIFEHGVKWFHGLCSFFGTITLESYLTNGYMSGVLKHVDWTIGNLNINPGNYLFYFCVLVFGLLWAIAAHKCSESIQKKTRIRLVKNAS